MSLLRVSVFRQARAFSTAPVVRKSATEAVKDTVKTVDRKVSDVAVTGIEKGEQATAKAKDAIGVNAKKAEANAQELKGEAKGKASELQGKAKGTAEEIKGKM